MLDDLVGPLQAGRTFELTLEFANAGTVRVPVKVDADHDR